MTHPEHGDSVCACEMVEVGRGAATMGLHVSTHVLWTSKAVSVNADSRGQRNLQTGSVVKVSVSLTHLLLLPLYPEGEGK